MGDHFPLELGFYITTPKVQGWTIHKLFESLSEHPCVFQDFDMNKYTRCCPLSQDAMILDYFSKWETEIHFDTYQIW